MNLGKSGAKLESPMVSTANAKVTATVGLRRGRQTAVDHLATRPVRVAVMAIGSANTVACTSAASKTPLALSMLKVPFNSPGSTSSPNRRLVFAISSFCPGRLGIGGRRSGRASRGARQLVGERGPSEHRFRFRRARARTPPTKAQTNRARYRAPTAGCFDLAVPRAPVFSRHSPF